MGMGGPGENVTGVGGRQRTEGVKDDGGVYADVGGAMQGSTEERISTRFYSLSSNHRGMGRNFQITYAPYRTIGRLRVEKEVYWRYALPREVE